MVPIFGSNSSVAYAPPSGLRPVINRRGFMGGGSAITTASRNSTNDFLPLRAPLDTSINGIVLAVGSWQFRNSGTGPPPDQTVDGYNWLKSFSIEYNGVRYQVRWQGEVSIQCPPGFKTYYSDPLIIPGGIPAGAQYILYVSESTTLPANGVSYPTSARRVDNFDAVEYGTNLANKTMSGTITPSDNSLRMPFGIYAVQTTPGIKSIGILGDSHFLGAGDGPNEANADGQAGYVNKSIANSHGCLYAASGGTSAQGYVLSPINAVYELFHGITHLFTDLGFNDVYKGLTLAECQAYMRTTWAPFIALGTPVYATTVGPMTDSTDGWATLVNQTVRAVDQVRLGVNAWLRGGGLGLAGLCDIDAWLSDSGKWRVDGQAWTTDGTHQSPYAITQTVAAGIVPAALRT